MFFFFEHWFTYIESFIFILLKTWLKPLSFACILLDLMIPPTFWAPMCLVKNPPAMQETLVQSLGWGDPLEKGKATHFSIPAWRIPWTVQSMGLQRVGHDLSDSHFHVPYIMVNPYTILRGNYCENCSVVFNFLWPYAPYSLWNFPGQNTGVGSLSLL